MVYHVISADGTTCGNKKVWFIIHVINPRNKYPYYEKTS